MNDTKLLETSAELVAISDERDVWLGRIEKAWREGWAAAEQAHAGDYELGFADGVMSARVAQAPSTAALARDLDTERRRWALRGEPRTRETFGKPHKDDYPGQGGAGA